MVWIYHGSMQEVILFKVRADAKLKNSPLPWKRLTNRPRPFLIFSQFSYIFENEFVWLLPNIKANYELVYIKQHDAVILYICNSWKLFWPLMIVLLLPSNQFKSVVKIFYFRFFFIFFQKISWLLYYNAR